MYASNANEFVQKYGNVCNYKNVFALKIIGGLQHTYVFGRGYIIFDCK